MALEHITKDNFKEFINQDELVIIDFWASWCGPCRMLTPVLEELNRLNGQIIGKVNVDEEEEISQAFGIRSIPTLLAFKSGNLVGKTMGYMPLEKLANWADSLK